MPNINDDVMQDVLSDVDQDNNLLNNMFPNYESISQSSYYTINQYNSTFSTEINYFSIFHQNVRSIKNKFDLVTSFFDSLCQYPDVLIFTENWLDNDTKHNYNIKDCASYHCVRTGRAGGGLSVFVGVKYVSNIIEELSFCNTTIEVLTVGVTYGNDTIFVVAIYRPHSDTIPNFTDSLLHILNNKKLLHKRVIVVGDLNINLLLSDNNSISNFINEFQSFSYLPVITKPTRFASDNNSNISPSLLDHIWLNFFDYNYSGILLSDLSDHNTVFIHLPMANMPDNKIKLTFRNHSKELLELFEDRLNSVNWCNVLSGDINNRVVSFESTVNELYCNTFPLKIKYISIKRLKNPWITRYVMSSIKYKSKLFKSYKLGFTPLTVYKSFCRSHKSLIRQSKSRHYNKIFTDNKNNIKNTWKILNDLLNKNCNRKVIQGVLINDLIVNEEQIIANEFNTYFSNIATSLDSEIPASNVSPCNFINFNVGDSFFLSPSDSFEIVDIINALKKTRSDVNMIPVRILCKVSNILSVHISDLINYSFSCGSFPDSLKIAHIIPIHKHDDRTNIENYRPISILPTLSKIFERCMVNRLLSYIDRYNIISDNQFGFLKGKSTGDAILSFVNFIQSSLNNREHSIGIFVDLRKAFDTVNHGILLAKLNCYGIRGISADWFESYLFNRKQRVRIGNCLSHTESINIGVPQGSVLAPILFLLYINDLVNVSSLFHCVLFADDTTLCSSDVNFSSLVSNVSAELNTVSSWMSANRLSLNVNKTYSLIFSNCDYNVVLNPIIFNDSFVDIETRGKFLGLIVDNRLTFSEHISSICKKLSKTVGILYSIKDCVPLHLMIQLYYSLAYPYIHYCNLIWSNTYQVHLNPLIMLQKRLIRIITDSDYLDHTGPLFEETGILTVNQIHIYMLSIYMFKMSNSADGIPTLDHNYNTRYSNNAAPSFQRLTSGQHSALFAGADVWNKLPNSIKYCETLPRFKKLTKDFIRQNYD